ncbi:HepT-like ribonuclease domain-containing protein [Syntrophorhabdus aromaticivorans]|uniref:HepT-like ribonuclease domain-containing protein n=1 Tax=Syntrophorhabdus aromaticivorans TaxID=328301 RepID=UPI0004000249
MGGVAGSFSEIFYILQQKEVISHALADKMVAMVGFRNILVHEYEIITSSRLAA